nr:ribonuclease H-like domain-containing protein [Tanacetum cinerariifolium]
MCYGKSKKQSHKAKSEDTNQEKLYLLPMDLYRHMRVASVNEKKYILVIVDYYSWFTWVKFLESKDEAPDFIIKFLKMIQVRLNAAVRNIRTDNGTYFVNQTLRDYYEQVGISHETSIARPPQQNGIVERRNHTLVEAARTILIFAQALLFLWAEAIATTFANALRAIDLADSPVPTSIDQDAPSKSIPSTQDHEHSLIISQGFKESAKTSHFQDDPLHESLHEDSTSQGSSSNMRPIHTPFESLGRQTKDHSIKNVIRDPSRSVSTRKKLQTDAMWCYFDAFLTFIEPKNFKQAMIELSWIDAMQEEIHEFLQKMNFDHLQNVKLCSLIGSRVQSVSALLLPRSRETPHGWQGTIKKPIYGNMGYVSLSPLKEPCPHGSRCGICRGYGFCEEMRILLLELIFTFPCELRTSPGVSSNFDDGDTALL